MYNSPHYLEKIKRENSIHYYILKYALDFSGLLFLGWFFQCCSLARMRSGFFSLGFFFLCERLKTHLSCYHWKHVFLLIHIGVPVKVSSAEMLSLLSACWVSNICYCFPGAAADALGFERWSRARFPRGWEDFPVLEGSKTKIARRKQKPVVKSEFLPGGKLQLLTNSVQKRPHPWRCASSETLLTLQQLFHPRRGVLGHPAGKARWGSPAVPIAFLAGHRQTSDHPHLHACTPASSLPISRSW